MNEAESKKFLTSFGVPVPEGRVIRDAVEAASAAEALGIPHKTDVGGVRLNLHNTDEVSEAAMALLDLSESCLIEKMVEGVVAELIVGVACDIQFGPYLVLGGGGILVEMMKDSVSLLLPTTNKIVTRALGQLKCAPLFSGFRGSLPADLKAATDVIMAVAGMVENDPSLINELDINPLMLLAEGRGAIAADALISVNIKPEHL
jgi:acetyl-CoA synthetase